MDKYISSELSKQYSEYKDDSGGIRSKAIIDLVLQNYMSEGETLRSGGSREDLDPTFRAFAICQIRIFVFVGHGSTSSTICYLFDLLYTNPVALPAFRQELNTMLGAELTELPDLLKSQPHLLNDLPYTTAVIKEALRLFPPGGCSRAGQPTIPLVSDSGKPVLQIMWRPSSLSIMSFNALRYTGPNQTPSCPNAGLSNPAMICTPSKALIERLKSGLRIALRRAL